MTQVRLRIAGINLHCGLDGAGAPYDVKDAIARLDAEVILVQENWAAAGSHSVAATAAADCGFPHFAGLDLATGRTLSDLEVLKPGRAAEVGDWGLAVMSRLPLHAVTPISLGTAAGDPVGRRLAQVVEIDRPDGRVRLVNVHLTHRLLHGPAQLNRLTSAAAGSVPTAIVGDLNMCRPMIGLARPFRPAVRGRTWPAHRRLVQLDHILVGPGLTAIEGGIGPAVGSDHLPVQATLAHVTS